MGRGRPKLNKNKFITPDFEQACQAADTDTLKRKLLEIDSNEHEVAKAKSTNEDIVLARESLTDLVEPYSQAIKELKTKRAFVIDMMKERGVL